jgi:phasin family protein
MEPQTSPANLLGEIARMIEQFKLPGLDAAAVLERRRKDIEALAEANRIARAGVQDLAQKQGDILQKTLRELQGLVQDGKAGIAQNPAQFGDLVHKALHDTLGNMRDLAEIARKSQTEAFGVVSERMQRNIEELKASLVPPSS